MATTDACVALKGSVSCYWEGMWHKLDQMRQLWQLCDVVLLSEDKEMFMAHSPVLAASSQVFHSYFVERIKDIIEEQPDKALLLHTIPRDVLQVTLDFIYGKTPTNLEDFERLMVGTDILRIDGASVYCKHKISQLSKEKEQSATTVRILNRPFEISPFGEMVPGRNRSVIVCKDLTSSSSTCSKDRSGDVCPVSGADATEGVCPVMGSGESKCKEERDKRPPPVPPKPAKPSHPHFRTSVLSDQVSESDISLSMPGLATAGSDRRFNEHGGNAREPAKEAHQSEKTLASKTSEKEPDGTTFSSPLGMHIPPPLDLHHAVMADMSLNDLAKNMECPHLRRLQESQKLAESMDLDRGGSAADNHQVMDTIDHMKDLSPGSDDAKVFCDMTESRSSTLTNDVSAKSLEKFNQLGLSSSGDDLDDADDYYEDSELSELDVERVSSADVSDDDFKPQRRFFPLRDHSLSEDSSANDSSLNRASSEDSLDIDHPSVYRSRPVYTRRHRVSPYASPSRYDYENLHPPSYNVDTYGANQNINRNDGLVDTLSSDIHNIPQQVVPLEGMPPLIRVQPPQPTIIEPQAQDEEQHFDWTNERIVASLRLDSTSKVYSCLVEGCDYTNKHMDYLRSHLHHRHSMGIPTHPCGHCTKAYFSESQLNNHIKRTHDKVTKQHVGGVVHCGDCEQTFQSVYKLQTHQLKVHGKGKLFTCDTCTFKSPRKKDVQAHMLSQHGEAPPGVRVYSCPFCDYKCIDRNRYEEHEAMHTGEQKYKCSSCAKSYTTRRGLRTHQKYHSEDRPYHCSECGARFKVRSKLKDHTKLGVKPYQCGYCDHRTALRGNCNQHIKKHHPGFPVNVIDHLASQRKSVKDYDYAQIAGEGIEECHDVRAARWASIGNSANFFPPAGPVGVIDMDAGVSDDLSSLVSVMPPSANGEDDGCGVGGQNTVVLPGSGMMPYGGEGDNL